MSRKKEVKFWYNKQKGAFDIRYRRKYIMRVGTLEEAVEIADYINRLLAMNLISEEKIKEYAKKALQDK